MDIEQAFAYPGDPQIPPYRLGNMMKTASKITDIMLKGDISVTYKECLIILEIVRSGIVQAAQTEE